MAGSGQPWLHGLTTVLSAPTVALSEPDGQIRPDGAQGVLHADARVLSKAVVEVDGLLPAAISGGLLAPGRALFIGAPHGVGGDDVEPAIRLEREREVTPGRLRERIRLECATTTGANIEVSLRVSADLAGIGEIKNGLAGRPAEITVIAGEGGTGLAWGSGTLRARLAAPGATATVGPDEAVLRWPVSLPGRGEGQVSWELTVDDTAAVVVAADEPDWLRSVPEQRRPVADQAAGREQREDDERRTDHPWAGVRLEGGDPRLSRLVAQSLADAAALRMAIAGSPEDVFLAAGAPWFFTLFGRDRLP